MGYTTHAETDLIGFGVSAISHIGDSYSQNPRDLPTWEAAIDTGRLPVWRGMQQSADDVVRADLIQQLMCRGVIDIPALEERHGIHFLEYFEPDLIRLCDIAADGLVSITETEIRATSRGRLLLRIIAACFDYYLHQPQAEPVRFSKAI
jgi:oxygen-independent coproporphyrinogen-3 oxidase